MSYYEKEINSVVEGKEISGLEHREKYDISVSITKPYKNLSDGSHIAYFASGAYSFDGDYGDKSIIGMLERLYKLGMFLETNMNSLKTEFHKVKTNISELSQSMMTEAKFRAKRILLRKSLRSSEIDNKEYEQKLKKIKTEKEKLEAEIAYLHSSFFVENFKGVVTMSNRYEIIEILEDKRKLL